MTFQVQTAQIQPKVEKKETKIVPLRNDRSLEEWEIEAENNAIELSI